ncbi:MAG TPA: FimV/HubP family polar landmark protein [Steroidobacteraceae bacterium]|nr:FimV/HubP family polar landmark protein [Steroidobacteraceae bacterium]
MFAKRSSRALALLLVLPSAAFALGLGDIHLNSSLNSPLDAQIEITDVAPDEANTVRATLAAREVFSQNGLDYPTYLTSVQLRTVETPDGHHVIKIKSADPITDPFITLLINVSWSHGQLVREYTMLLDPPVYTPNQPAVANAPVSAPATGAESRAGTIARNAETPPPAAAAPAPSATAEPAAAESAQAAPAEAAEPAPTPPASSKKAAPAPSATAAAAPEAPSASPAPAGPSAEPGAEQGANTSHVVQKGETLSEIARGVTGASTNNARTRSWMLAIYQANPKAFEQNMNLLRSGAVVRIPDAATAEAVSPADATAEINRQFAAWRSSAAAPAGGAATGGPEAAAQGSQPGRLKLVTPSEGASAGTGTAANAAEVNELKGRVHDLEGQLAESKRLLDLKNQDLARLQSELAAKQAAARAPAPAPVPAPAPAPAPVKPPVAQAAPPPPAPVPAEKPAAREEQPPPVAAAAPPAPKPIPKPLPKPLPAAQKPAPAPAEGGSILDTIIGYWWVLALVALVLAVVAGLRFLRSRRASEFDDSLGRLAVAAVAGASGAGGALSGGGSARGSGGFETPPMRAMPLTEPEPDIHVEETGTHERPRIASAGAAAAPTAAKHVTADDTISSETAINLDQGDPLAEADFHMAYGLYDQAADLIRIAIGREPGRRDLKLKLLEVFFVWGNKEQFLQTAHELAQTRSEAAPGEWEKILIMGKQLAPEDALFSGGAAVGGAAAGGVDLNLEGGQSRVDFDLLGEPVPTEGQGVDLDIGAAVGEGTAQMTEASTGVTDRNLTVLQGGGGYGDSAATGSTRQMTAKMRQQAADAEGPTVEQPTLETPDDRTVRAKIEPRMRGGADQTAELAIDDLGLDLGQVDTQEQPVLGAGSDQPTMVAGLDEKARKNLEDTAAQAAMHAKTSTTGQWQFDQDELESALTQAGPLQDGSQTSRLAQLRGDTVDIDVSSSATTGTHPEIRTSGVDLDLGTGTYPGNGGKLDLDVGTATVPDAAFAATQRLANEDLALPDLEPVTMSEVGTKLDLARAYMDMGDPDGARNILEEVMTEGSAAQKQEAQRLMESLPG